MARPEPSELIPDIILIWCERHKTSISRLSMDMGHADNWISGMFKTGQPLIQPYIRLAEAGGISLQALAEKIRAKKTSDYVEFLLLRYKQDGVKHRADLSRRIGISKTTLSDLCKNDGKLNGLKSLSELAAVIGCEIDDLRLDRQSQAISA